MTEETQSTEQGAYDKIQEEFNGEPPFRRIETPDEEAQADDAAESDAGADTSSDEARDADGEASKPSGGEKQAENDGDPFARERNGLIGELKEERRRRSEAEKRAKQVETEYRQKTMDERQFKQWQEQQSRQEYSRLVQHAQADFVRSLQDDALRPKAQAAQKWIQDMAQTDPDRADQIAMEIFRHEKPWEHAAALHRKEQITQQVGDDPKAYARKVALEDLLDDDSFKAELLKRLQPTAPSEPKEDDAATSEPKTVDDKRTAGGETPAKHGKDKPRVPKSLASVGGKPVATASKGEDPYEKMMRAFNG